MKPFLLSVSIAGLICLFSEQGQAAAPAGEMTAAAGRWLASLTPEQKAKAVYPFQNDERENWHFVPMERKGLTIKEMKVEQIQLAHALLRSALSAAGYAKATNIMSLEPILHEMEGADRKFPRDPELYHFFIFGQPSAKETWGWRFEGHHVSINVTLVDGHTISVTPSFFGSNPAEVRQGPRKGLRVLAEEEDFARTLVHSLDAGQRRTAVIDPAVPKEIFTEQKRHVQALEAVGIRYSTLSAAQQASLRKVIDTYLRRYRPEIAATDWKKIEKASLGQIQFAWYGGLEKGEGHYYRVQGPTFLLEYDNTQNNNNHAHAVWRDFTADFGEDLLRQHYERDHAK